MKLNAVLTMAAVAALACLSAAADVIYDNGAQDNSWVWMAGGQQLIFDDFELTADATLADVHWSGGAYYGYTPATDSFGISIFADNAGAPGTLVHQYTGVSATRVQDVVWYSGDVIYSYSADVAPLNLTADTRYWISIYHENSDIGWYWSTSNGAAGNAWSLWDGSWWDSTDSEFAFYLTSTEAVVPEPATMSLLGLGLAALGLRRARRFRAR